MKPARPFLQNRFYVLRSPNPEKGWAILDRKCEEAPTYCPSREQARHRVQAKNGSAVPNYVHDGGSSVPFADDHTAENIPLLTQGVLSHGYQWQC